MRTSLRISAVLAALLLLGLAWLVRPLPLDDLVSTPDPAQSYEEAMARWARAQEREAAQPLHEGGRSIVLTHGYKTD
jgi:hypothetical protein